MIAHFVDWLFGRDRTLVKVYMLDESYPHTVEWGAMDGDDPFEQQGHLPIWTHHRADGRGVREGVWAEL